MSSRTENPQQVKMVLWSVFSGSKGCTNRVKIVRKIRDMPYNTNRLAKVLDLDYKVVERHLEILQKNNLVTKVGGKYGTNYYLSALLKSNLNVFEELTDQPHCKENLEI